MTTAGGGRRSQTPDAMSRDARLLRRQCAKVDGAGGRERRDGRASREVCWLAGRLAGWPQLTRVDDSIRRRLDDLSSRCGEREGTEVKTLARVGISITTSLRAPRWMAARGAAQAEGGKPRRGVCGRERLAVWAAALVPRVCVAPVRRLGRWTVDWGLASSRRNGGQCG